MFTTVEGDDDDNNHGCVVFQQWYISNDEQPCYHLYILQYMELLWGKTWTCVHEPTPRFANIDDTRFINSYIYILKNLKVVLCIAKNNNEKLILYFNFHDLNYLYLLHMMDNVCTMGSMLTHILATCVTLVQLIRTIAKDESILSIVVIVVVFRMIEKPIQAVQGNAY